MKNIAILGSTGSIGTSTLDICQRYPDRYHVVALAAGRNVAAALEQCRKWRPAVISMADEPSADQLKTELRNHQITGTEVVHGTAGTVAVATHPDVTFVVSAIVGVAGLQATYAAAALGREIGLANKEAMVAAGELIIAKARETGSTILPIDSEHNAIHQCMRGGTPAEVKQIWLTASGGPFRNTPLADFARITPQQALKHPTWVMGQRITVDSATMLNKGLEIIEACRLFDLPPDRVRVTIHPQSTIHSLVEYVDGSILAQLSVTDMRLPILYAMAYPERVPSDLTFDLATLSQLDFQQPDLTRFPCLGLAYQAARVGGTHCIALNAADEIAVEAFLSGDLPFLGIPETIERVLAATPVRTPASIAEVLTADESARQLARELVRQHTPVVA
ncbi:1-deoxy-D-xylulose-5-phosphate reductoisomerase [Terriglobus sp.]|uniref:1-deoxy-D-xylulose-5-phosphate reductoisomerase n=1 Tax=Terriglobus sp. TaxID=1889013 RepID=UPI003AFFAA10